MGLSRLLFILLISSSLLLSCGKNFGSLGLTDGPVISGVLPGVGSSEGGILITVNGGNFRANMAVSIGGKLCGGTTIRSASQATCTLPSASAEGHAEVVVKNTDASTAASPTPFSYIAPDRWNYMAVSGDAPGRYYGSAVWTGSKMIVWGGHDASSTTLESGVGAAFDPATNSWAAIAPPPSGFSTRGEHSAIWTGSKMIVWGGVHYVSGVGPSLNDGASYDPAADAWTVMTAPNPPVKRYFHHAFWTGATGNAATRNRMIVYGGNQAVGGIYDTEAGAWKPMATANGPGAREFDSAVWTGSALISWGGRAANSTTRLNTGAVYDPAADTWKAMSQTGVPSARESAGAVWTGSRMLVVGGSAGATYFADGARYDRATDTWAAIARAAINRVNFAAVWTGSRMLIFQGNSNGPGGNNAASSGEIYDPLGDTWTSLPPTSLIAKELPLGVWTGNVFIGWGGLNLTAPMTTPAEGAFIIP